MGEILRKQILIVDDEAEIREILAVHLQAAGYRTLEAHNGLIAHEVAGRESIDAVVSDIRMPRGDGIELLQQLRARHADTPPVAFMTGFSDIAIEDAYHLGARAVLGKPFEMEALLQVVNRLVRPRDESWADPTPSDSDAPLLSAAFRSVEKAGIEGNLVFGRGGFMMASRVASRVRYEILFEEGRLRACRGSGIVRWVRKAPGQRVGIEFESLEPETREYLRTWIARTGPVPFIPKQA